MKLHHEMGVPTWLACEWGRSFERQVKACDVKVARDIQLARRKNPLATLRDIRLLRDFIVGNRITIVHSHLVHDHWLAALAIRGIKSDRPRLVRTVHRHEAMRRDLFHWWLFTRATDHVITVSTQQQREVLAAYPSLQGRCISLIPGGVDTARFRPQLPGAAQVRADLGEPPENMVAGIVAHLGHNRGHKWLLAATPKVFRETSNTSVWVVGQGEIKHWLRAQLKQPELSCRMILAGYRTDDLPKTYCAMDVALLLGLGSEGTARAALEAMACAKPVIAVREGALIDMIQDGVTGHLVEENDVDGLAAALIRLLSNRSLCRQMGAAARAHVEKHYHEKVRAEKTLDVYQALK